MPPMYERYTVGSTSTYTYTTPHYVGMSDLIDLYSIVSMALLQLLK